LFGAVRIRRFSGASINLFAEAIEALVEKLDKETLAKTDQPRTPRGSAGHGYVTRAARRAVVARDGLSCSFVSTAGERCSSKDFLEFDHRTPRARGGSGDPSNLRILCRAHNQYAGEQAFGRAHVESRVNFHRRKYRPEEPPRALVERALTGMGFRKAEIERALSVLEPEAWTGRIENVLREAISALT
jgi:5-methylcytosine-specific restriction endonuclease McrA